MNNHENQRQATKKNKENQSRKEQMIHDNQSTTHEQVFRMTIKRKNEEKAMKTTKKEGATK